MALDCVSAAINTLVPKQFSAKVLAQLMANGNREEAKTIRHLNYVKHAVDPGGNVEGCFIPKKRKATTKRVNKKKKGYEEPEINLGCTGQAWPDV